jgi:hypothetical protein
MRLMPVTSAALFLAAACSSSSPQPVPREFADATVPAATAESERAANLAAYRFLYLPEQPRLAATRRGGWLAVAGGKVVPSNGQAIVPAATIEEAAAAAVAVKPEAKHRFVFRIGDEGDVVWPMGGCELAHVVGVQFIGLFEDRLDVEMKALGPGQKILAAVGGPMQEITVKGPDDRMYVRPEVGPPGAAGRATEAYCISTGFGGMAVVSPTTAEGLELWEIPGSARITEKSPEGVLCRRAYARFAWPGSNLDFTVPVAIWPK